jgi:hypothetical protein
MGEHPLILSQRRMMSALGGALLPTLESLKRAAPPVHGLTHWGLKADGDLAFGVSDTQAVAGVGVAVVAGFL